MKRILSNLNKVVSLVLALVVVLLVNWIVLTNPVRIDLSGRQYYSLSDKTTSLLKGLEHRVDVIVFFQEEHKLYHDIENLLEEYQYHSRNIHVEWVDPARDLARTEKLSKQYGLTEAEVVVFDVDGKSKIVKQNDLADIMMVKGRRDPILSAFKGEQAFSSAIQGLIQGKTPKVYFLVGHGEKRVTEFDQVSGYTRIGTALVRDNLELEELLLTGEKKIPEDAAALIIAGPDKAMSATEVDMVEDYLRRSGRVMILLDALKDGGLEPMLRRWGVGLRNDFVVDPENRLHENDVHIRRFNPHPITMNLESIVRFVLPRSVEPLIEKAQGDLAEDRPSVVSLAMTSDKGWSETQVHDTPAKYDENTGDLRGSLSLAVAVERGAPQKMLDVQIQPSRMVVFGDSDFISNGALTGGDQDLFMSAMNWLLDREELMAIAPKPIEEIKLSLTRKQLGNLFWINVAGIPLVAVAGGLLVWIRRRK